MFEILTKRTIGPAVYHYDISAPNIARKAKPGQFLILRINETGERIPLTICDYDGSKGTVSIMFQAIGKTTKELAYMEAGDSLSDMVGPLGRPSEIERLGTVVCVAGGVGAAVILPIAKALKAKGNEIITILGARTAELLVLEDELKAISDDFIITTDDGSRGISGVCTDPLRQLIESGKRVDRVIAIGPAIMMKFVCKTTEPFGVETVVSLNSIMVDGTGMCGSCRVTIGGQTKFCCVDGPDFDGHEVDFDELMIRQRIYLDEEKASLERFERQCEGGCGSKGERK
ncbi:MAG: sulfide/dihydroorotate dehydrogenase-like FAD/NAD-binding protein [Actinomycetota bacterium]|nr:sulfide/dihydroorotate dehydrogenase-like FAD/NAD-binding protein [Actinomycetota bacterium]